MLFKKKKPDAISQEERERIDRVRSRRDELLRQQKKLHKARRRLPFANKGKKKRPAVLSGLTRLRHARMCRML